MVFGLKSPKFEFVATFPCFWKVWKPPPATFAANASEFSPAASAL